MALPTKHVVHQGRVLASLGGTAVSALLQRLFVAPRGAWKVPSEEIAESLPPRDPELLYDYVRHVGGDPAAYKGVVPPHFWPQWGFPLAAKTLRGIPYPMHKVMNGGSRLEIRAPLPADEPLEVRARLESVDDDGRRAVLHQRVVTGTASAPEALVGHLYAVVPLASRGERRAGPGGAPDGERGAPRGGPGGEGGAPRGGPGGEDGAPRGGPGGERGVPDGARPEARGKKEPPRVPTGARELAYWRIPADAGLAFAMLTGDFNPVHWVKPYARAFGFSSTILHGFATMARAIEGLNRARFAGAVDRLRVFDCKFTRPLTLPARVGLYVEGHHVYVGNAPGGPAYLMGTFEEK